MTRVYYRGARGCVVMFDLSNRASLDGAARWKKEVDSKCAGGGGGGGIPCLLLANKCDLQRERVVGLDEIEELHRRHNFIGWTETSAKVICLSFSPFLPSSPSPPQARAGRKVN